MSLCVDLRDGGGGAVPDAAALGIGGKARALLRLAGAGYRVPRAFAVEGGLFRRLRAGGPALPPSLRGPADLGSVDRAREALIAADWPSGFLDELSQQLEALAAGDTGARFAVRSSFAREDGDDADGGIAAGVYESVVDVERTGVPAAIRRVLASGLSPGAVAYAQSRRRDDADDAPVAAVLVHRYIGGESSGSAALDPAGRQPPVIELVNGTLGGAARAQIEHALSDLAARQGHAVEIEWVIDGEQLILLQLRPYVAPAAVRAWTPADELGPGAWRWDAAHNPLPLSPAQAGLVALVDERCRIGVRQRVARGYLFCAPGGAAPVNAIDDDAVGDELTALNARFEEWMRVHGERPALEEALAIFVAIYDRIYGVIQPAARRATRALEDFLRTRAGSEAGLLPELYAGVASIAEERHRRSLDLTGATSEETRATALGAYLARFGDEAPVWDVAVPTYREDPSRLRALSEGLGDGSLSSSPNESARIASSGPGLSWQRAAREIAGRLATDERAVFTVQLDHARRARAAGEDDDWLYARAQAAVRAALLREGQHLADLGVLAAAGDVFWLRLERVRAFAGGEPLPARAALQSQVATARAAHAQALQDPPELGDARDLRGIAARDLRGVAARPRAGDVVSRGQCAAAGRVIGPAFIHRPPRGGTDSPARAPNPTSIVVAATLLPTELPLLRAAGLVVESGGVLDHVAAQARERGIPALVGARGACAGITDGDLLLLDADNGQLIRLA